MQDSSSQLVCKHSITQSKGKTCVCMFVLPLGFELFLTTHSSPGLSFPCSSSVVSWVSTALQGLCFHLTGLIKDCFCSAHLPALLVLLFAGTSWYTNARLVGCGGK